jgi:peptidoglycan-N-acetylglucosamine deacetylase
MDAARRSRSGIAVTPVFQADRRRTGLPTYVTTSWDDGHPLDLRTAELLARYGIRGTFYVPKTAEHETMAAGEIRALSAAFEVGAHTIRHADLTGATDEDAWQEISRSKMWIEDVTGCPCLMFCPPRGHYANPHLDMTRRAGYLGLRSTELASLDFPRRRAGLLLMPTSLQAHPQGLLSVARNALKRAAPGNLWRFIVHGGTAEWPRIAESLLRRALLRGGVFHLWGHSWELEANSQWGRLDDVLRLMGEIAAQAPSLTNGEICRLALTDPARDARSASGGGREARDVVNGSRGHVPNWADDSGGATRS